MAGRYNRWLRAKLADRIKANGGRHDRHDSFALSWCVRYYGTLITAAEAKAALVEYEHVINEADLLLQMPDFEEEFTLDMANAMWDYAQEHLQDDLHSDEGLRMWSPETARRYGFDYTGPGADRPFEMALGSYGGGGGGKHVCLTEFEGRKLKGFNREFAEMVQGHGNPDSSYPMLPNLWCRQLMGIMDELDEALTEENAKRRGRYYEADHLACELGLLD